MNGPSPADEPTKDLAASAGPEAALLAGLDRLPPRFREMLLLYHRDNHSYETIATRLGLSTAAVQQLHREAVAFLARELHVQREPPCP